MGARSRDNLFLILLIVAIALIAGFFIFRSEKRVYSWWESYRTDSDQPYDAQLFFDLINETTESDIEITSQPLSIELAERDSVTYIMLNNDFFLDSASAYALLKFVERGNRAILISNTLPGDLLWQIRDTISHLYYFSDTASEKISMGFYPGDISKEDHYEFEFRLGDKTSPRSWYYDSTAFNPASKISRLGYFKVIEEEPRYCNFFSLQVGEGTLLFHTTPLLFTNYALSKKEGFEYANEVVSHLPNQPVLWDGYHMYYYSDDEGEGDLNRSLLRYILDNPALKYAWYTLISAILLFLFFRSKRQQRIIPIIPKVENTSIEFAKSLGTLYYESDSPRFLANEMLKLFNNFNRRKYGIDRKQKEDPEIAGKIATKSKAGKDLVEKILTLERQILYNPSARMKEVVKLYVTLQEYYKKARK